MPGGDCVCISGDDPAASSDAFAAWLGECVFSPRERASFYVGLVSLGCWVLCQLPQIVLNAKRGSAAGLSVGLLAQWIAGDSMVRFSLILSHSLHQHL